MSSLAAEVAAVLPQGLVQGYLGVVKAISSDGAVTVDVRGAQIVTGVSGGYVPTVGDTVMVMRVGTGSDSWVAAFKVAAAAPQWQQVTLSGGWTHATTPLRWRRGIDGDVKVSGAVIAPSVVPQVIGSIPIAAGNQPLKAAVIAAWNGGPAITVRCDPDGTLNAFGDTTAGRTWWITGFFPTG